MLNCSVLYDIVLYILLYYIHITSILLYNNTEYTVVLFIILHIKENCSYFLPEQRIPIYIYCNYILRIVL